MRKICCALVLCMLLLAAFGTYYIVRDSRSSGGSR